MKKIFTLAVALALFLNVSTCAAAERIIEASGEYFMDIRLDETPASATARAREEAKRIAVERAGVYLRTHSKVEDFELVEDEIETIASSLLKILEEVPEVEPVGNEKNLLKFKVTIKALVNDLSEADLKNLMKDKQALAESARKYKELKAEYDALKAQMEQYKAEFDKANEARKVEIKKEVTRNSVDFSAVEAMARGNDFYFAKNYSQALAAYDEAIKLNPKLAEAYNNRGFIKYHLGQFAAAVEDYSAAIRFKSNFFAALNNRGNAYAALGQFQNAMQDLKAALKLENNSAIAHNNLGSVYYSLKNFDAAIEEYTKAINLNPHYADACYNRAVAYYVQGNPVQALIDAKSAISLNPTDTAIQDFYKKLTQKTK